MNTAVSTAVSTALRIYRIQLTLQDGSRHAGLGCFADTGEALEQTWADYPEAMSIAAICLRGAPPATKPQGATP